MQRSAKLLKEFGERVSKSKFHSQAAGVARTKSGNPTVGVLTPPGSAKKPDLANMVAMQSSSMLFQSPKSGMNTPEKTKSKQVKRPFDVTEHLPTNAVVKNNDISCHSAQGLWVFDKQGRRYLDMTSGIGCLGTGHSHPRIVNAVKEQLHDVVHAQQAMFFSHSKQDEFIEEFLKYTPGGGRVPNSKVAKHDQFLFTSSGSEATENAVKVAKMHTKRPNVIALNGGFHGRTFGAMAWSSSKTSYKSGFSGGVGGVFFCHDLTPEALDQVLAHQSSPEETACIILEPIQGEGGVVPVPTDMLQHIRKKCDEHGIVLIFDEVQCGSGRAGTFWAHQQTGVEPDILCFAKAIASGLPFGGICAPKSFFENLSTNSLGSTFGGSALGHAAALETIRTFKDEQLIENGSRVCGIIAKELQSMPYVENVRQFGSFAGVDLNPEVAPVGKIVQHAAREHRMIVHTCGKNALRVIPSYTINEQEAELFCDKIYQTLKAVGTGNVTGDGSRTM